MNKKIKKFFIRVMYTIFICTIAWGISVVGIKRITYADSGFDSSYSGGSSSSHSSRRSSSSGGFSDSESSGTHVDYPRLPLGIEIILFISPIPISLIIFIIMDRRENPRISARKIKKIIPDFDEREFLKEGARIYEDVQKAWMDFELEKVRNVITDEMFNMYSSQLETLKVKNEKNIMKDIQVYKGYLTGYQLQNGELTIITRYIVEQYDYIIDVESQEIKRGTDKYKLRMKYELRFKLVTDSSRVLGLCPNCGATLENYNGSGVCQYCGSKIVGDNSRWVLTDKKAISQGRAF